MRAKTKTRVSVSDRRPASQRALTVGQLSRKIVRLLEEGIGRVSVEGEVSNLRVPASGHAYFVLKDSEATINCVCFRGAMARLRAEIEDGRQIEVRGRLTAYTARSEYQIIVEGARAAGLGELMRRFMELRDKLAAAGLFDEDRKKPLPSLPRSIGIVTSSSGAALRDILNVLGRRARGLDIRISPCAVQGDAAPGEIVRAIGRLGRERRETRVDVIIVARGGGSIEDLWAFNDERVVEAVAACAIPVISGVGHEIDTTLADLAADVRAPTPSAAAEIVTAGYADLDVSLGRLSVRLGRAQSHHLERSRNLLDRLADAWPLARPDQILADPMRRVDEAGKGLEDLIAEILTEARANWLNADHRLALAGPREKVREAAGRTAELRARLRSASPARVWGPRLAVRRTEIRNLERRLRRAAAARVEASRQKLSATADRLTAVGPPSVLKRGYSFITTPGGRRIITGPGQARVGQTLKVHSAGGTWKATPLPDGEEFFDDV